MCRVVHVPRVSRCTDSGKTPGNRTENLPSSPPYRDWPDCLAVGGVRSEPVSSPRCGYCPSSAAQRTRGSSCDGAGLSEFAGVRGSSREFGSSWELGALGEPSLDFAPGVRSVLGGRLSQTERSSAQPDECSAGEVAVPPGSSRHDQLLAESHTISPSRTALLRLTGTLYRALEPRLARELTSESQKATGGQKKIKRPTERRSVPASRLA